MSLTNYTFYIYSEMYYIIIGHDLSRYFEEKSRKRGNLMEFNVIMELFEAVTILCFGLSWPISIRKSLVSKTAQGKSLFFEVFLLIGYAFGITRKIMQLTLLGNSGFLFFLSFFFYVLNFVEISIDVALYFRNSKLDKLRAASAVSI